MDALTMAARGAAAAQRLRDAATLLDPSVLAWESIAGAALTQRLLSERARVGRLAEELECVAAALRQTGVRG